MVLEISEETMIGSIPLGFFPIGRQKELISMIPSAVVTGENNARADFLHKKGSNPPDVFLSPDIDLGLVENSAYIDTYDSMLHPEDQGL